MTLFARLVVLSAVLNSCSAVLAEGMAPFGELLFWHASQESSSVWASTISASESRNTFSAEDVRFNWNAAFRVGIAHEYDEQSWDARLYWTSFRTADSVRLDPGGQMIMPEFFSGFVSGAMAEFDSAALNWDLHFNNLDFEVGRTIGVGEFIALRPSMGLKGAIIDQQILAHWARLNAPQGLSAIERVDHEFRGIGPSFGIDGRWQVAAARNLSVIGSFSMALLWGVWNVDDTYERTDETFPAFSYGALTTSMHDASLGTVNLNYFLGVQWIRPGDVTITGRLGYELQWWANQQRLPTFQQLPMHGDLTLQGLTCGISVIF